MGLTAEDVWEQVQALPPSERLKLVERVKSEVVNAKAERQFAKMTDLPPILEDLTDEEFEDFQQTLRQIRQQPNRAPR